jgi:hypothetical protein
MQKSQPSSTIIIHNGAYNNPPQKFKQLAPLF